MQIAELTLVFDLQIYKLEIKLIFIVLIYIESRFSEMNYQTLKIEK